MQATSTSQGCGSSSCGCHDSQPSHSHQEHSHEQDEPAIPRINGVALYFEGAIPEEHELRELACTELLRQEAVRTGHLPAQDVDTAPRLDDAQRAAIEQMVDAAVTTPEPTLEACQRYYDANKAHFVHGQALRLRHILFAVTPGVNVQALAQRAEEALLTLGQPNPPPGQFAELARTLSNCPSGQQGGELGWVTPHDCAPELTQALFFQSEPGIGLGLQPRLVHTRYGLHIIDVVERRPGELAPFDQVREPIAAQLALRSRATALRQYLQLLIGQAELEGLVLDGADTPLVQ